MRQETAALGDFNPAYVRLGSVLRRCTPHDRFDLVSGLSRITS